MPTYLYQNILKLRDNKVISIRPEFCDLLKAEAIKNRYNKKQLTLLTHQLKTAAKELRNHPNITIKKADKTNIFVVLNKIDYHSKLQNILDDHTKFKKLDKNPTNQLKSKINKLITANNAELNSTKLPKIIGDYKPNHPLRPIISQIPTPIYQLTKTIKQLISPYLPSKYNIKSTHELIQVLHTIKPNNGILASLDVENLFTNVPVNETIDIIINNIYNNPSLPPLKINPNILRKLLLTCTTEVPFYDHLENIYVQTDGVSMGSVLGPIFSNFYMSDLENRIFNSIKKPPIYLRYVDDILILTNNINEINILQDTFQNNSVLNFTHELNKNNKISFLDVFIDTNNNNNFTTSTYKKPSSNNSCTLNFKSECPFRYKKAIIRNVISRAKLISSSKTIFYKEVKNKKQALIDNGFPNYIVDEQINRMIKNVNQQNKQCTTPSSQQTYIKLFYRNQMHYNYKSDEKIMKTLIHKNILPTDPNKKIKLIIYYNKFKTSNLVIRNNSSPLIGVLQKTNVIYKFKCPLGDCISDNNNIYVGLTSTTLSWRLTMHLSDTSSIAQHLKKTFMPNNTTTKNSHRQHNNTRTSK